MRLGVAVMMTNDRLAWWLIIAALFYIILHYPDLRESLREIGQDVGILEEINHD